MRKTYTVLSATLLCMILAARPIPYPVIQKLVLPYSNGVNRMIFDSKGLMWMATNDGVYSFDGYTIHAFRNTASRPHFLPNNTTLSLTEGKDSMLWIGTTNGIARYNMTNGTMTHYCPKGKDRQIIYNLRTTHDGSVWACTNDGLAVYDELADTFVVFTPENSRIRRLNGETHNGAPRVVKDIVEDKNGHLFVGTWGQGLLSLDRTTHNTFQQYEALDEHNIAYSLYIDSRNRLWIGTWHDGLICMQNPLDISHRHRVRFPGKEKEFKTYHRITEDHISKQVIALSSSGIALIPIDNIRSGAQFYTEAQSAACTLKQGLDLQTDQRRRIWLTNSMGQILQISPYHPVAERPIHITDKTMPFIGVKHIYSENGQLFWLALHPYGLALYDSHTGHTYVNRQIPALNRPDTQELPLDVSFNSFLTRRNGELWIGGEDAGLLIIKDGQLQKHLHWQQYPWLRYSVVRCLYEDSRGKLWVGFREGIIQEEWVERKFTNLSVNDIQEDHLGHIWLATDNEGILCLSDKGAPVARYKSQSKNLPADDVFQIHEDQHKRIWAVSRSAGLMLLNRKRQCFSSVSKECRLNHQRIFSMEEDSAGNLWLTTEEGFSCLTYRESGASTLTNYPELDTEGKTMHTLKSTFYRNDTLYYSTSAGFNLFHTQDMRKLSTSEKVNLIITSIWFDGNPVTPADAHTAVPSPAYTRSLTIPASVNKFSIEASLLNYSPRNSYSYRLEGYNQDWVTPDNDSRRITFENIPDGHYRLHIKATDGFGQTTELPYCIEIHVLPPWYRTWWAILIYMAVIAGSVWMYLRWYRLYLTKMHRLQQNIDRILAEREQQMHRNASESISTAYSPHTEGQTGNIALNTDNEFVRKAVNCVMEHLDDGSYDRESFARDMNVSSSTLYNKLKSQTGQNVTGFILAIRLKEAIRIATSSPEIRIKELAGIVGFDTPNYFTKCFKKEYGMSIKDYVRHTSSLQ